jgi:hypothetical protein
VEGWIFAFEVCLSFRPCGWSKGIGRQVHLERNNRYLEEKQKDVARWI